MDPTAHDRARRHRRVAATLRACLLLCVAALLASAASADDDPLDRTGFYVGGSGIYTHNFFDHQVDNAFSDLVGGDVNVSIDDSSGFNARVGYRAFSWFALELQYEWVDNFETRVTSPLLPGEKATIDITGHSLTLDTKWIVPTWRVQPYLLVGAGYSLWDADTHLSAGLASLPGADQLNGGKESGFAARGGAGIDWILTEHLALNTEVTMLVTTQKFKQPDTGSIDNLYYLSMGAGLQYRF